MWCRGCNDANVYLSRICDERVTGLESTPHRLSFSSVCSTSRTSISPLFSTAPQPPKYHMRCPTIQPAWAARAVGEGTACSTSSSTCRIRHRSTGTADSACTTCMRMHSQSRSIKFHYRLCECEAICLRSRLLVTQGRVRAIRDRLARVKPLNPLSARTSTCWWTDRCWILVDAQYPTVHFSECVYITPTQACLCCRLKNFSLLDELIQSIVCSPRT